MRLDQKAHNCFKMMRVICTCRTRKNLELSWRKRNPTVFKSTVTKKMSSNPQSPKGVFRSTVTERCLQMNSQQKMSSSQQSTKGVFISTVTERCLQVKSQQKMSLSQQSPKDVFKSTVIKRCLQVNSHQKHVFKSTVTKKMSSSQQLTKDVTAVGISHSLYPKGEFENKQRSRSTVQRP